MEKQWIENLRKRFADRKKPAPDGLWESIEAAMQAHDSIGNTTDTENKRARIITLRARRIASVAACLIVFAGTAIWFFNRKTASYIQPVSLMHTAANIHDTETPDMASQTDNSGTILASLHRNTEIKIVRETKAETEETGNDTAHISVPATTENSNSNDNENTYTNTGERQESVVIKHRRFNENNTEDNNSPLLADASHAIHRDKNMSIALYGAGITSIGYSSGNMGISSLPFDIQDHTIQEDYVMMMTEPLTTADNRNTGNNRIRVKHRQPVKIGMGLRFKLTGRLGIETGMSYSFLSSDITSENQYGGDRTEQRLHYVGIPVSLSCDIWHNRHLEIYAAAGGTAEFCVNGQSHTEYLSEQTVTGNTDNDIREKRPQWSVNAQAGVQYNFSNLVGVYLEPGVSYYFNNGSSVDNIYKEKPLNFNLNLGLRFTIR